MIFRVVCGATCRSVLVGESCRGDRATRVQVESFPGIQHVGSFDEPLTFYRVSRTVPGVPQPRPRPVGPQR